MQISSTNLYDAILGCDYQRSPCLYRNGTGKSGAHFELDHPRADDDIDSSIRRRDEEL